MSGAILPLPQYAFKAWCLVKRRYNFTFIFTFTFITKQYNQADLLECNSYIIHKGDYKSCE